MQNLNFGLVGGRTFALAAGCGIVTSLMRWFDHLDNGSFTAIVMGTVGAYIASTTFQKHTEIRADVQKTITAAQAESPPTIVQQVPQ